MLTIETTRFSAVVKAFVGQFPAAEVKLDGKIQSGPLESWCTNEKLKAAINLSLVNNGNEILGFHDGPRNMWASKDVLPLVTTLAEEKVLRFEEARYRQGLMQTSKPFFVMAVILFLVSIWFFLWFLSSSSLAFVECNGTYSFSAINPRCRNPAISSALFAASFLLSIGCLVTGFFKRKRKKK